MSGTLLAEDWQNAVQDRLNAHIKSLQQSTQSALQQVSQPAQQVVQALPQIDPNAVQQRLSGLVDSLTQQNAQPAAQVFQPIGQDLQNQAGQTFAPMGEAKDAIAQRLQQHVDSLTGPQAPQATVQTMGAPPAAQADVLGAPSADVAQSAISAQAPLHEPSPPVQTEGTQLANTPDGSGRIFPLAAKPSNTPTATYHSAGGSDLMAPRGTPVLNMQSGRVDEVFTDNGSHTVGGNAVLIHGDDGLDYYYAHFDQPTGLKPGQRVETGAQIGAVGNSGNAYKGGTGETHLHIGIGHGISNGVGSEGGLGQDFNAQKLLTDLESGVGQAAAAPIKAVADTAASVAGAIQAKVGQGQQAFVDTLKPLAQEVANRTGIDPNAMLAIAANETGWGRSQTAQQQNNLFSIQGDGSNGSRWASYSSPGQAFDAFVNLIRTAPRYAQAWQDRGDPGQFVDDLRHAGYVVDEPGFPAQGWVDQVKSIYGQLPPPSDQAGPSPQRAAAAGSTDQVAAAVLRPPTQVINVAARPTALGEAGRRPANEVVPQTLGDIAQGVGGAFSGLGSAAQGVLGAAQEANKATPGTAAVGAVGQVASDLGSAVSGAYGLNRPPEELAARSQQYQQDVLAAAQAMNKRSQEPQTLGGTASDAWNLLIGANPPMGISLQQYQDMQQAKNTWIDQNNPARQLTDAGVPLVEGLTTAIAQQLTDPLMIATFGPSVGAGRAIGAGVGRGVEATLADQLSPQAVKFASTVADKLASGAFIGGVQNALMAAEKPDATPESVFTALWQGAALGGVADAGMVAAAPIARRIGQSLIDNAPQLRAALSARQPAQAEINAALGGAPEAIARLRGGETPAEPVPTTPAETAAPAATDVATQMQRNFLRDTVRAPKSDPRPMVQDIGLANEHLVHQNDLTDLLPQGTTVLYHETSVPNARAILDRIESGPRNQTPIFTSDNRDLALGQGGKGVTLEFDPSKANGSVAPQKPGLSFTAATGGGQEYTVSRTLPGAVSAIVVRTERQAAQLATNARVARSFDFANAEPTADGGIRIPRRETTAAALAPPPSAPVIQPESPAVFRAPETTGAPSAVPVAAASDAFAGARAAPGEAVTATTPTARVTVREGGSPLPPREPPVATAALPPPPGGGGSSPELDKLNAMYDGKKPAPASSIGDRKDAVWRSLTRAFTDRQVDINQAQQRYAANLGRPLRGDEMAAELQRLASDPAAQVKVDQGLKPAIQSVGSDYPALRNYVTLRSNIEIADNLASRTGKPEVGTDRLFSGGLDRAESVKAMQDLEQQLGPERFATVQAAADQVTAFNKSLRQRLVDAGVLDEGTAAQLDAQYPNWAKTRILDYMADPAGGQGAGTKIGLSDRQLREYTLKGTERAREDPVASTVAYAHQVERMAMKNEAFNAFLQIDQAGEKPMLREVPQSYTPKSNEVTMIGFVDGQKTKYVTDNKALGAAINGAGVMSTPEWTSAWQKIFRSLATSRNPAFLAGNAALDIPTYVLRSAVREGGPQALPRILGELARGYGDAFQGLLQGEFKGENTARFLKGGGGQAGYFTGGEGQTKRAVAEMQRKNVFQINGAQDMWRLTKDLLTLHPVEALGERIELGPRVAAMRLAERRSANPTQAIIDGRTVTVDFSQGGTVTKYLNNFIPFFNVGFQGPAQIARAFRDNPRAFVATVGTLIGVPSAAAEVWNRSDPQRAKDYADVPQYVKDQGVVIMLPGEAPVDKQGNRKPMYALIKLREWTPFATIAREAADRVMGDDSRSWQEMASSTLSGLSPIQAQSAAQVGTEPLGGIPILPAAAQLQMNTDFFRGRTIVSQRADQNASAVSKAITPAIQAIVDRAGINAEVRPSAIDFLVRNQGAGVGGAALSASDLAAGEPSDTAGPTGLPVAGGLIGRFAGNQTGDELQQARDRTLTTEGRQTLRNNGITLTPGAVSSSINQIPLKIDEETRYQQLANQYIDEAIQRTAASPDFATKTQVGKQSMMDQAMQAARQKAGIQVLNTIPADEKSRRLKSKSTAAA